MLTMTAEPHSLVVTGLSASAKFRPLVDGVVLAHSLWSFPLRPAAGQHDDATVEEPFTGVSENGGAVRLLGVPWCVPDQQASQS